MAGKVERRPIAGEPVSVPFLAQEFGLSAPTVKTRLAGLKPADTGNRGEPLYRISEAATLLVGKQRLTATDIEKAMKSVRPQDLPAMTQAVYWDAMRKRQAWERDAGQLWRTEDVLDVLTDMFRVLRETIRLWADEIDSESRLTSEQLGYLRKHTDKLQETIHKKLQAIQMQRETPPSSAYIGEPMLSAEVEDIDEAPEPLIAPRAWRNVI